MQMLKKITKVWTFSELFIWPFVKMVSFISLYLEFLSFRKAISKWDKFTGKRKATQKEVEEEKRQQKIKHWIYHIERNPEGFKRLAAENFEKEAKKRIQKQADELKKHDQ